MAVYQGQSGRNQQNDTARKYQQQRELAGTRSLGVSFQNFKDSKKGGGLNIPFGGFGRGGGGAGFALDDLNRQLKYDETIFERSTPNVRGRSGKVNWDRDNNTVSSELTEDNQAIYDSMFKRQSRFGTMADDMAGEGWKKMQQDRFNEKKALFVEEDARERAIRAEREQNTGATTTAKYYSERAAGDNINRRNMLLAEEAFNESQGLLDANLSRQSNDIAMLTGINQRADDLINIPTPNTVGNMGNVSLASTRYADNLAMESALKKKGQSDFLGSLLGNIFS